MPHWTQYRSFRRRSSQPITWLILTNKTVQENTDKQTQHKSEKVNNLKYSRTKQPWFSCLLQHSARKRTWAYSTTPPSPHGAYTPQCEIHAAPVESLWLCAFLHRPLLLVIVFKYDVIHKTGTTPPEKGRDITDVDNVHNNGEDWTCSFGDMLATERHADRSRSCWHTALKNVYKIFHMWLLF